MIGWIRGILLEKHPPQLTIETHGLGYEVDAPMSTFYQLPEKGKEVCLFTHLVVREDAHQLYGFYTQSERFLFRLLLKVNGIGPRLALAILSHATPPEFARFILDNDATSLIKLPGIGKKTAERLVIEMRDKMTDWKEQMASVDGGSLDLAGDSRHPILQDTIAALIALGYKQQEANRIVAKIDDGAATSEMLIRKALQRLG